MLVLNGDTLFELDLEALCAFISGVRRRPPWSCDRTPTRRAGDWSRSSWTTVSFGLPVAAGRMPQPPNRGCSPASIFSTRVCCGMCPRAKPSSIIDAYVAAIQRGDLVVGLRADRLLVRCGDARALCTGRARCHQRSDSAQ